MCNVSLMSGFPWVGFGVVHEWRKGVGLFCVLEYPGYVFKNNAEWNQGVRSPT